MAEYTAEQFKAAARKAYEAGDISTAKKLIARAQAMPNPSGDMAMKKARIDAAKAGTIKVDPAAVARADELNREGLMAALPDVGAGTAATLGVGQGVTFGGSDEAVAAMQSLTGPYNYDQNLEYVRLMLEKARKKHPVAAYGGEVAGAVVLPGAAMKTTGSLLGRAATSGAVAGGEGILYGFLSGDGGGEARAKNAATTGILSAALGGAAPVVGAGAKRLYNGVMDGAAARKAIKGAPSMDDLRMAASGLYKQADQVTNLPRGNFATTAQSMLDVAARKGMDPDLTPGAAKAADRIMDAATMPSPNIGFSELDILRRKASVPAGNLANRTESAIGSQMIEGIDDFVNTADPALGGMIKEAREMWGRLRRSEAIQKAMARAEEAASGYENGLAIEFRRILKSDKLSRGFSASEKKAMQAVVRGTPFGNMFRQIGKMGIGLNRQSNGLGAMAGSALGGITMGPMGNVLFPAVGTAAKAATNAAKRGAANDALSLVLAGGAGSAKQLPVRAQGILESILRRSAVPVGNQLYPNP